jgi:fucose 4-O-acetylase-like acetyltransferase
MSKERINWMDIAKGLGIVLVIIGHTGSSSSSLTTYIFSFHMPLFFFISGYLFSVGKYDFKSYFYKKLKTLLIPYFVFAFLTYIFWAAVGRKFGADSELDIQLLKPLLGIFYSNGNDNWLIFNTPLWFLTCLFLVEIGFYMITRYVHKQRYILLVLIMISIAGYLDSLYLPFRFPWGFDVALSALAFYGYGHLIKQNMQILRIFKGGIVRALLSIAFLIVGYFVSEANGKVDMNLNQYGNYIFFYMAALSGIAAVILISQFINKMGVIRFIGQNTLVIMLVHMLLLSGIKAIVVFIFHIPLEDTNTLPWVFIYTVSVLIIASPIIYLINNYLGFTLGKSGSRETKKNTIGEGMLRTAEENNRIYLKSIVVLEGNTVQYSVKYGTKVSRFFTAEPLFVQFDRDISGVPDNILIIPLLANLCPVAWIAGADVYVEELDLKFYESLIQAKQSFSILYPRIKFGGEIHVKKLIEEPFPAGPLRTAAFFSGGVDSTSTFIQRKNENPYFITVWGADIGLDQTDMWHEVEQYNAAWSHSQGYESLFIKSNFRSFLNEEYISFHFGRFTHGWWPGIQHGIGLVGLVAPLAYALGIKNLYVPSALPPKLALAMPDGSNTMINNNIRWTGTKVQLEGEELSRQNKVALIAQYIRSTGKELNIRVCWSNQQYGNCCRCEKCLRTIAALLAEGIDPRYAGFPVRQETYEIMQQQIPLWLSNNVLTSEYWNEIKLRSIENNSLIPHEAHHFFKWLQLLNIQSYSKRWSLKSTLIDIIPHPLFLYIKKMGMKRVLHNE